MNPVIVINVNMGSMGHRVGRLIASCTNILWYDHKGNGVVPWETCSEILNADIAKFHYDRRFADLSTIPPVLDYARRSGLPEMPEIPYDRCQDGQYLTYVTHSDLDESRKYFKGKHVVVLNKDIDRFFETSWKFRVGKTRQLVSEMYTKEEVESILTNTLANYEMNINPNDFVINSVDDLLDMDTFKLLCEKFNLTFNEYRYNKVRDVFKK